MTTNRRLMARVLAPLTVLLAACSGGVPVSTTGAAAPASTTVAVYAGPVSPPWTDQLHQALDEYTRATWTWVAAHRAPIPVPVARRRPQATVGTDAGTVTDGDRFDRLSSCESKTNDTGDPYWGYFQFRRDSWNSAWSMGGFDEKYGTTDEAGQFVPAPAGLPSDWSYGVQKSVAMFWATVTDPYRQWPVCWPRSA